MPDADREMQLVRGLRQANGQAMSEDDKLRAFMAIFHPEREPMTRADARRARGEK